MIGVTAKRYEGLPISRGRRALARFFGGVTGMLCTDGHSITLLRGDTNVGILVSPDAVDQLYDAEPTTRKDFGGNFLLWRRRPNGKLGRMKPEGKPQFRHPTQEAAEAEAARLLELMPDSTFVVLQEIAIVKPVEELRMKFGSYDPDTGKATVVEVERAA